jgi:hypothetical protein
MERGRNLIAKVVYTGGRGGWKAGALRLVSLRDVKPKKLLAGDPSLRLKSGYARDDAGFMNDGRGGRASLDGQPGAAVPT